MCIVLLDDRDLAANEDGGPSKVRYALEWDGMETQPMATSGLTRCGNHILYNRSPPGEEVVYRPGMQLSYAEWAAVIGWKIFIPFVALVAMARAVMEVFEVKRRDCDQPAGVLYWYTRVGSGVNTRPVAFVGFFLKEPGHAGQGWPCFSSLPQPCDPHTGSRRPCGTMTCTCV